MSHEQLIRKNRVFILGAGFSAAAGVPLTNELLVEAMKLFAAECPGIYSRVENYALEAMGSKSEILVTADLSFSDLCTFLEFIELREYGGGERWSSQGSREKLALRFYLAKTIVKRTPSHRRMPDLYSPMQSSAHFTSEHGLTSTRSATVPTWCLPTSSSPPGTTCGTPS